MSQEINLYEARLRPRHELATASTLGLCTLVFVVAMVALSAWSRLDASRKSAAAAASQQELSEAQGKLAALTKLVTDRKVSAGLAAEIDAAKALLAGREDVIAVLDSGKLGNTDGFFIAMAGFARQARPDVWLTGFQMSGSGDMEIRGRLLDPARLPGYVQSLSAEPVFKGRRFAALEMQGNDPQEPNAASVASEKAPPAAGAPSAQPLPHYVDFILRSENSGAKGAGAGEGAKR